MIAAFDAEDYLSLHLPPDGEILLDQVMSLRGRYMTGARLNAWNRLFPQRGSVEGTEIVPGWTAQSIPDHSLLHRHPFLIETYGPEWLATLSRCGAAWIACVTLAVVMNEEVLDRYQRTLAEGREELLFGLRKRGDLISFSFSTSLDARNNYMSAVGLRYIVFASSREDAESYETLLHLLDT